MRFPKKTQNIFRLFVCILYTVRKKKYKKKKKKKGEERDQIWNPNAEEKGGGEEAF